MDWSCTKHLGPSGTIRAMSAHFQDFAFTAHEHDYFVIGLIGAGLQRFELGAQAFVTPPGHLMLINPGESHTGRSAAARGFSYLAMYPTPEDLERLREESDLRGRGRLVFGQTLVKDVEMHGRLWRAGRAGGEDALAEETTFILAMRELLRRYGSCSSRPAGPDPARREVLRARDYLHAHPGRRITLGDLAGVSGLSPYHLARMFRAAFGLPPHKYLEGLRVRRAQELVVQGLPLVQVALEAGFNSQSHLNRSFKRVLGVTPAEYRR